MALKAKQQGMSMMGIIMIIVVVLFVAISALKVLPSYLQDREIAHIFTEIVNDPAMKGASVRDVRDSFQKRAVMDSISAVTAEDIKIDNVDGQLVLSASYEVKVPLAGNATLVLDFNPRSAK